MSPHRKIETLTNAWYGYALFASVVSVFQLRANGLLGYMIGFPIAVVLNAVGFVISCAITAFLGRRLLARSNGTRRFLVLVSAVFTLLGVLSTATAGWAFLTTWSIPTIAAVVLAAAPR